jgi:hypothetical protein
MGKQTFHIEGMDELIKQISNIQQLKGLKAILLAAGMTLKGKLSVYPAQKSLTRAEVYGQTFKTDKQRRYFFWALKTGEITVPYSRGDDSKSERFKAAWAVSAQRDGLRVVVGNDTTYGPLLMDPRVQSKFMAEIGWQTTQQVMDENAEQISTFAFTQLAATLGLKK